MPIHDWTRVDAGTFHAFHTAWVTHLSEMLNGGILPSGYYAMPEQHVGRPIGDVLTLSTGPSPGTSPAEGAGGLAVAEAPPRATRMLTASATPHTRRRTLAVRHVSGHRVVALVEIVSPANKDRPRHVNDLASKVVSAVVLGIHVLLIDLFPPGPHDPHGIHGAVWQQMDPAAEDYVPPPHAPLAVVAYVARPEAEAYLEPLAVGYPVPDMPLFLHADRYVNAPLTASYDAAFRGMPGYWRNVLEGGT